MVNNYNYVLYFAVLENNRTTITKLRFDFSLDVLDSTVTRAEFYVYVRPIAQPPLNGETTMILVHLLPPKTNRRNNSNKVNRKQRLIQKQKLPFGNRDW